MTQSWKNSSWKLGLGIAIATSAIAACGYYALAEDRETPFLIGPPQHQITNQTALTNLLQLTSLRSDASVSNISARIKETGATSGPYTINSVNPIPLNMSTCFNNTVTVQLLGTVGNPTSSKIGIVGQQALAIGQYTESPPPMTFTRNGIKYTIQYQIVPAAAACSG